MMDFVGRGGCGDGDIFRIGFGAVWLKKFYVVKVKEGIFYLFGKNDR